MVDFLTQITTLRIAEAAASLFTSTDLARHLPNTEIPAAYGCIPYKNFSIIAQHIKSNNKRCVHQKKNTSESKI